MINYEISTILESEKELLNPLMFDYLFELNENENYPYFNLYWQEENRIPYKLTNDSSEWLGFALINDYTIVPSNTISIAEFYILPEYRKQGLGRYFATEIIRKYNGNWEIRTQKSIKLAINFWDNVVSELTNNNFKLNQIKNDIIYSFIRK